MRFIYTKTFTKIFSIFVFLALLVILDAKGYTGLVKGKFFRVYGSITNKLIDGTIGVKNVFSTWFVIKNLVHENAALEQKVDALAFDNARLKSAQDENTLLRKALNFQQQSDLNLAAAEVLSADPTGFSQTLVIDKGTNNSISLGRPVVVAPGILIGRVSEVNKNSSVVTLITDPSIVINAEAVDSSARGLMRGEHGLGLTFDLITQNELIKTGDEVITSGLSSEIPRGLLIGTIGAIRSSPTDLFQKSYIAPGADLRNLRFLFVVL